VANFEEEHQGLVKHLFCGILVPGYLWETAFRLSCPFTGLILRFIDTLSHIVTLGFNPYFLLKGFAACWQTASDRGTVYNH
jgi:hypothetical protein